MPGPCQKEPVSLSKEVDVHYPVDFAMASRFLPAFEAAAAGSAQAKKPLMDPWCIRREIQPAVCLARIDLGIQFVAEFVPLVRRRRIGLSRLTITWVRSATSWRSGGRRFWDGVSDSLPASASWWPVRREVSRAGGGTAMHGRSTPHVGLPRAGVTPPPATPMFAEQVWMMDMVRMF